MNYKLYSKCAQKLNFILFILTYLDNSIINKAKFFVRWLRNLNSNSAFKRIFLNAHINISNKETSL